MMNQAIELQQLMFSTDKETSYLVDQVNENKHLKRKIDDASADKAEETDEDDEEIYSDTDEEFQANQRKKSKPSSINLTELKFKHIKPDLIENYLEKVNKNFNKYK